MWHILIKPTYFLKKNQGQFENIKFSDTVFYFCARSRYLLNKRGKYISVFKKKCNVNWVKFCFGSRSESNGEVISGSESNCCGSATLAYRYQYMSTEIATGRYLIRHTGAGTGTGTWYIAHNVALACCCWSIPVADVFPVVPGGL